MLFTSYINRFYTFYRLVLVLSFGALLSACANAPDQTTTSKQNSAENIKHISGDIVEMIATKKNEPKRQSLNKKPVSHQNLYLEQQQARLANVPKSVVSQYKEAVQLLQQKKYQQADKLFCEIIKVQPNLSGVYVNKALISVENNALEKANSLVDKAIAVNKINPYAHHLKAQLQRQQGHFKVAQKSYEQALVIWPDYAKAHLNLAILLELYRGQLLQAKQHYEAYLVLQPKDKKVQRWLAGLVIKIKRAGLEENKLINNVNSNSLESNRQELSKESNLYEHH